MTITYLVDGYYNPADELGVAWDDPAVGADWGVTDPILSAPRPGQPRAAPIALTPPAASRPATSALEATWHEALRHRRRRLHRLELRPPRARHHRRRGHGLRRAHLRRQPRQPPRRRATIPRFRFVQGDICDRDAVHAAHGRPRRRRALRRREPRRPLDRRPRRRSSARTATAPTCCATWPARSASSASCTSPPTRCTARSRRARSARPTRSSPARRTRRRRPARDLIALVVPHDLRPAGRRHPLVEQLRAVPVPREGHPAVRHQPARRADGCRSTATASTCATGATSRTTAPAVDLVLRTGRRRRDLQHRRRQRDAPTASSPTACSRCCGRDESLIEYVADRLGHDRRYSIDTAKIDGARLEARARRSTRRSRPPSPGTATTAGGGSRSRQASTPPMRGPRHRGRRPARPRRWWRACARPATTSSAPTTPRSTSPTATPCSAPCASTAPDAVVHCAALDRGRRLRGRPGPGLRRQRPRRRATWPRRAAPRRRPRRATSPPTTCSTAPRPTPYVEWDEPEPAVGLRRARSWPASARARRPGATVVRTSWVCGAHGANMVKTMLRLAAEHADAVASSTTSAATPRSPPTWRRCCAASPSSAGPALLPRHQPGRGQLVRVRRRRSLAAAGDDPDRVQADRHRRPPAARARRRARPTRCSTTPRCGARAWRWHRTTASRSTASWRAAGVPQKWSLYDHFHRTFASGSGIGWVSRTRWSCRP